MWFNEKIDKILYEDSSEKPHPFKQHDEYQKWLKTLTSREYDREAERLYYSTEYVVHEITTDGDTVGGIEYKTLTEAKASLKDWSPSGEVVAALIEKVRQGHNGIDGDLEVSNEETVYSIGDENAICAGSWVD